MHTFWKTLGNLFGTFCTALEDLVKTFWKLLGNLVEIFPGPSGNISDFSSRVSDIYGADLVDMLWRPFGDICCIFGDLLFTFWRPFGNLLETFWRPV